MSICVLIAGCRVGVEMPHTATFFSFPFGASDVSILFGPLACYSVIRPLRISFVLVRCRSSCIRWLSSANVHKSRRRKIGGDLATCPVLWTRFGLTGCSVCGWNGLVLPALISFGGQQPMKQDLGDYECVCSWQQPILAVCLAPWTDAFLFGSQLVCTKVKKDWPHPSSYAVRAMRLYLEVDLDILAHVFFALAGCSFSA